MYTPNFVHEVYNLYRVYAQRTKLIGRVHQPSITNVSPVIYGPMYTPNFVQEVYNLYRAYVQLTKRIGRVYSRYKAYRPCTPSIPYVSPVIYGPMYTPNFPNVQSV